MSDKPNSDPAQVRKLVGFALVAIGIWLAVSSARVPFLPSHLSHVLFWWVIPICCFAAIFLVNHARAKRNAERRARSGEGEPDRPVLAILVAFGLIGMMSFFLGVVMERMLAWPSYYFAATKEETVWELVYVSPIGHSLGQWDWVAVRNGDGYMSRFPWKSSDPQLSAMQPGARVAVAGRSWFLGTYVDSFHVLQ